VPDLHPSAVAIIATMALSACGSSAVEWQDPTPLPTQLATAVASSAGGREARALADVSPPAFPGQCAGSVRVSRDSTGDWYAAWWSARRDSTADVVVSRSADGKTWRPPVRVDTLDAGRFGCQRPPPSIAVDGANVHVAYAMAAREGPGIFASHSMDGGAIFHSPVAVVYGGSARVGMTSIAARGQIVVIAYEDPNSTPTRVGLALSRTMGHPFEYHDIVSPPVGEGHAPSVALGRGTVLVTWTSGSDSSSRRVMRVGRFDERQ
jgi:hypothetical protein